VFVRRFVQAVLRNVKSTRKAGWNIVEIVPTRAGNVLLNATKWQRPEVRVLGLQDDFLEIAADDEFGWELQDLQLIGQRGPSGIE
jgi:hypothetical protein